MLRLRATAARAARDALRSGGHRSPTNAASVPSRNALIRTCAARRFCALLPRRKDLPAGGARVFREHRLQGGVASTKGCGYHSRLAAIRRSAICEQEDTCAHLPVSVGHAARASRKTRAPTCRSGTSTPRRELLRPRLNFNHAGVDEVLHVAILRRQHLGRRAVGGDLALVQQRDAVCDAKGR